MTKLENGIPKEPIYEVCDCNHNGANHDIDGCQLCSCKRIFY